MKYLALALVCGGCASSPDTDNFNRPFEQWVPSDVRHFVIDSQACIHFSGEEPYDAERKAFLDRMIKRTCTGLDDRKVRLERLYERSPEVMEMIAGAWDR